MSVPSVRCRSCWQNRLPATSASRPEASGPGWQRRLSNGVLFQLGWLLAVQGNDLLAAAAAALLLLIHWRWFALGRGEWLLIAAVTLLGACLDSLLIRLGLFVLPDGGNWIPIWLLAIWAMFATTLCHAFDWLAYRRGLALVLGALAPPASYWVGERLAPLEFSDPLVAMLVLVAIWALLLPLLAYIAGWVQRYQGRSP